jgi:chromosome segregation ATPase
MLTKRFTGKGHAEEDARSLTSEEARNFTAAIEERDAAIAHLERTLTEQRAQVATLRDALERAQFKTRILEQSYSTQLAEARERAAAAERSAADQQTRITELEARHEELAQELAASRTSRASRESLEANAVSIDEMLASFTVPRERPLAFDSEGAADAPSDSQAIEEMLAPEVMFAARRGSKSR